MSINIDEVRTIVDSFVKRGIAYIIGLYPYLHSFEDYSYINTVNTLEPAFGRAIAEKVALEIKEVFKGISRYAKVIVEGREEKLGDYLKGYVLSENISRIILEELEKRFNQMTYEDKRILSVACAIIDALMKKSYPTISIGYPSYRTGGIGISSTDGEYFSEVVSSVLGFNISNVRALFYKYLLGFQCDWSSRRHDYYELEIYPFTVAYVKKLSLEVSNYIKLLDRFNVRSKLSELYQKGEYVKLALIERGLSARYESEFLSYFTGKSYRHLCDEAVVEGILSKCFVNPLIYDFVRESIEDLHEEALTNLITLFREVLEKLGYSCSCRGRGCVFTKPTVRPIYMYFSPWPEDFILPDDVAGSIKVIVVQGIPIQSILQSSNLRLYASRGFLWIFVEKGRVAIASNTYRDEDHLEFLKILSKNFSVEFIGFIPKGVESMVKTSSPQPTVRIPYEFTDIKPSREVLEDIVAQALKDLGFSVQTNVKLPAKGGDVEVDVWGVKAVGGLQFRVYASCKNWDKDVDRQVVDQEFGRILQLNQLPHLRMLVVKSLSEPAKKAALDDGFFIIELGEKASVENAQEIYNIIYNKLKDLFISIAPDKIREAVTTLKNIVKYLEGLV